MSADWIAALIGLAGAVIGGCVSAWTTKIVFDLERMQRTRSTAVAAQLKAQIQFSSILSLHKVMNEQIMQADEHGLNHAEPWEKMSSIVGIGAPIFYTPEELAVFTEGRDFELLKDMINVSMKQESLFAAMHKYNEVREHLANKLQVVVGEGMQLTAALTEEQHDAIYPDEVKCNTLLVQIDEMMVDLLPLSRSTVTKMGPSLRKILKDDKFPRFEPTE